MNNHVSHSGLSDQKIAGGPRSQTTSPEIKRPTGLIEKQQQLGGVEHSWVEYIPNSYTVETEVPLVVSLHGGGRSGLANACRTTWTLVAERENFIVVFPDSTHNVIQADGSRIGRWNGFYMFGTEYDDLTYLKLLIEEMASLYHIDKSRIYMQGQSNGDQMVTHFAIEHGNILAAVAGTSGPTLSEKMKDIHGNPLRPTIPLPFYRWHGEKDKLIGGEGTISRHELDMEHKQYWIDCNGCSPTPELLIEGRYNTEIYSGGEAEFRFTELVGGEHPLDLSAANIIWKDFFSRFARGENGEIITLTQDSHKEMSGVALVVGLEYALVNGKKMQIIEGNHESVTIFEHNGEVFAPLPFIERAFGAMTKWESDNERITIKYCDKLGILKIDEPLIIVNHDVFYQMAVGPQIQDEVYIPILSVAKHILGKHIATSGKAIYLSDNEDYIDHYTEHVLSQMLQKSEHY